MLLDLTGISPLRALGFGHPPETNRGLGRRYPQIAPIDTDFRQAGNLSRRRGGTEGGKGQLGSVPHIHTSSSQRGRFSALWVLASCGRIWFAGDGAFAPESWVGSAIQPYPAFALICVIRGPVPHIHTAEDCHGYNSKQAGGESLTEAHRGKSGDPDFET